ncbi:hypothetical protein VST7929_01035 [Vibrio stylophorae]|uniref:Uncharacterized protein n=1 Tax=Vibrio stylophorae TaxID=659351 RepID=A0ABM8ZSA2_9VIBR|nr:hypothetical protein [Vibrio stylophorae]CAH0533173.1 hypothetical protein VST7929_01035 [Vibrio stylophorae]
MADFMTASNLQDLKVGLHEQSTVIVIQDLGLAKSIALVHRISNGMVIASLCLFSLALLCWLGVIETLTGLFIGFAFELMLVALVVGVLGVSVTFDYKGYHLKWLEGEYRGEWMGRHMNVAACAVLQKLSRTKL